MNRLWPTAHFAHTQQTTHAFSVTPTQQSTHGDTRGPKAGCPQTHYAPAHAKHTIHTHRKAA